MYPDRLQPAIVSRETFLRRWAVLTNGAFEKFDWAVTNSLTLTFLSSVALDAERVCRWRRCASLP